MIDVRTWLDQLLLFDLPRSRRWSYYCFSLALCIALGTSQFVGPVKTAIFLDIVGPAHEPVAKSLVLAVLLPILVLYGALVSLLQSARLLVACVCGLYTLVFLAITVILASESGRPSDWLAWVLYYAFETKTVIVMPMIWSVVADVSTMELSKKAFPFVFFVVQVGGICGSVAAMKVQSLGGEVGLLLIQTLTFTVVAALSWQGVRLATAEELAPLVGGGDCETAAEDAQQKVTGWLSRGLDCIEGLWLFISRPYVLMVFWVSYANLMPRTILDYQSSVLVTQVVPRRRDQIAFLGRVNLFINAGVALMALLGTRSIVACCGIRCSLAALPVATFLCMLLLCVDYGLWPSVWALLVSNVVAFGLNSPCKEMLFIPTSREIKYKAKSWSEMYGNQLMKLFGAQLNLWVNRETASCRPHCFHNYSTLGIVVVWVAVWLAVVVHLGREHAQLEASKQVVS